MRQTLFNPTCVSCGLGLHQRHEGQCGACHHGRSLCRNCYAQAARDGKLVDYPLLERSSMKRECTHKTVTHVHGTSPMYIQDECRCGPCCLAHSRDVKAYRVAVIRGSANHLVDATGTHRRIQALSARGWALTVQARQLGWHERRLHYLMGHGKVTTRTARQVRDLYNRLSMLVPDESTTSGRISASKARARAARERWHPPLAWDDDAIDDPNASPVTSIDRDNSYVDDAAVDYRMQGRKDVRLTKTERYALVARCLAGGWSYADIERVTGVNAHRYVVKGEAA